ncbi:hypothetical protein GCM10018790_61110 [Kitasatospora xanthocidica]|nr:hypothetical protein GCM10018790_61110 [Kitasatospora xanthocidica]
MSRASVQPLDPRAGLLCTVLRCTGAMVTVLLPEDGTRGDGRAGRARNVRTRRRGAPADPLTVA